MRLVRPCARCLPVAIYFSRMYWHFHIFVSHCAQCIARAHLFPVHRFYPGKDCQKYARKSFNWQLNFPGYAHSDGIDKFAVLQRKRSAKLQSNTRSKLCHDLPTNWMGVYAAVGIENHYWLLRHTLSTRTPHLAPYPSAPLFQFHTPFAVSYCKKVRGGPSLLADTILYPSRLAGWTTFSSCLHASCLFWKMLDM